MYLCWMELYNVQNEMNFRDKFGSFLTPYPWRAIRTQRKCWSSVEEMVGLFVKFSSMKRWRKLFSAISMRSGPFLPPYPIS